MKPLYLEMSAFGSYAGKAEIDFTKIKSGIFLITGDTGSGKTTIYDAITYALYDRTSGNQRDGNMMRSQYAALDVPTYVRFKFEYAGQIYEIRRNPEYERMSHRKKADGTYSSTKESSKVSLIMPDGSEFMGKKAETNQKIVDIIGLDAGQFAQVVMIAQGDFLRLLHAGSRDRKVIFSKIFNTKIFWRIQEELKNRFQAVYGELEDNRKECLIHMKGIGYGEQADGTHPDLEAVQGLMQEELSGLTVQQKHLQEQMDQIRMKQGQAQTELHAATQIEELFQKLAKSQEMLERLESKKEDIQSQQRILGRAKKAKIVYEFDRICETSKKNTETAKKTCMEMSGWLKQNEPKAQELQVQQTKITELTEQELPTLQKIVATLDAAFGEDPKAFKQAESAAIQAVKANENTNSLARIQGFFQNVNLDFTALRQQVELCSRQMDGITEICSGVEELRKYKETEIRSYQELQNANTRYRSASEHYEQVFDSFLSEQAGVIAETLVDDQPCPVCGATQHPHPKELSEGAATQQQVEQAKKSREEAEKRRDQCTNRFSECKNRFDGQRTLLRKEISQLQTLTISDGNTDGAGLSGVLTEELLEDLDALKQQTDQLHKNIEKAGVQAETKLQEAQKKAASYRYHSQIRISYLAGRKEAADMAKMKLDRLIDEKKGALAQAEQTFSDLQKAQECAEKDFVQAREQQEFASYEEYRQALRSTEQMDTMEKTIQQFNESYAGMKSGVKAYQEQTEGKRRVDLEEIKSRLKEFTDSEKELEKQNKELYNKVANITEAAKKLKALAQKRQQLTKKYETISSLYRTANGNLSGSAKMDFETYVLRQYFRQVINAANRRLLKMVSGQFKLVCRDLSDLGGQGASGLDLDVYSMVTDSIRDVKTLSGGESFMAALSMALGLADIIQNSAGAVQLETMFIDEGFGSLDDESREQAIMILNQLAGDHRIVGIISHVTELKEQIDHKLIVEKTDQGSKVHWNI